MKHLTHLIEWASDTIRGGGVRAVVLLFALILAAVHGIATVIGGGGTVPPEPAKILHSAP